MFFFPPRYMGLGGRRSGKGVKFFFRNVFFIVEWLGRGSPKVFFKKKIIMGRGKGCTEGLGCSLIFIYLFFFTVEGEGGGG
jgi:hypothetical protein